MSNYPRYAIRDGKLVDVTAPVVFAFDANDYVWFSKSDDIIRFSVNGQPFDPYKIPDVYGLKQTFDQAIADAERKPIPFVYGGVRLSPPSPPPQRKSLEFKWPWKFQASDLLPCAVYLLLAVIAIAHKEDIQQWLTNLFLG